MIACRISQSGTSTVGTNDQESRRDDHAEEIEHVAIPQSPYALRRLGSNNRAGSSRRSQLRNAAWPTGRRMR